MKLTEMFDLLFERGGDLQKGGLPVQTVSEWKTGWHKKVSDNPPTWVPVKRDSTGKGWIRDNSRNVMHEDNLKESEKKDGAGSDRLVHTEHDGKTYTFKHKGKGKPTTEEMKRYRELAARKADKDKPPEEEDEPKKDEKEKGKRGRKSAPVAVITKRVNKKTGEESKLVRLEEGGKQVVYTGDKEVGDKLTDSEIEELKNKEPGKRGRKAKEAGTTFVQQGREYINLGQDEKGKQRRTRYYPENEENPVAPGSGEKASQEVIDKYLEIYNRKKGAKQGKAALFDFVPRERQFVRAKVKGQTRNPFSPPDLSPNRGEYTNKLKGNLYTDSGVQVSEGNSDYLTNTNYISEDILKGLYSHQADFVNQSMTAFQERMKKTMFNFDGTGAGKTRQQLALAETFIENTYGKRNEKPVFIITQNEHIINDAFLSDAKDMKIKVNKTEDPSDVKPGINIITYGVMKKYYDKIKDTDLVIFDEAHKMKGDDSTAGDMGRKITREVTHSALFTATPMDKSEHILYMSNAVNMDEGRVMESLGYKYNAKKKKWTKPTKPATPQETVDRIAQMSQLTEILAKEGLLVRREKSMSGLQFSTKKVEIDKKAAAQMEADYKKAQDIEKKAYDLPAYAMGGKWVQKMRSALENMKIDAAVDVVVDEVKAGRQVVFFATRANDSFITVPEGDVTQERIAKLVTDGKVVTEYKETDEYGVERTFRKYRQTTGTIQEVVNKLALRGIDDVEVLSSSVDADSQNASKKMVKIDRFQKGQSRVLVTTPQAGGTGLNLDDRTGKNPRTAVMMTPPFSANDLLQMLGRVHRLSSKSTSKAYMLDSDTATDFWNIQICEDKMRTLGAVVGGDVKKKLDPRIVKAIEGVDDPEEQAILIEEAIKGNLKPSKNLKKYTKDDFVSPANAMTGREFGMNDKDVIKRYGMYTNRTGAMVESGPYARAGYGKNVQSPLPVDSQVNWAIPVNPQSKVGRVFASENPRHPEETQFFVVVGKDKDHAYAKPVDRSVSSQDAMSAVARQKYGKMLDTPQGKRFLEEFASVGKVKKALLQKAMGSNLPAYNGEADVEPDILTVSDQLMFSAIVHGDVKTLGAPNRGEFLKHVW